MVVSHSASEPFRTSFLWHGRASGLYETGHPPESKGNRERVTVYRSVRSTRKNPLNQLCYKYPTESMNRSIITRQRSVAYERLTSDTLLEEVVWESVLVCGEQSKHWFKLVKIGTS